MDYQGTLIFCLLYYQIKTFLLNSVVATEFSCSRKLLLNCKFIYLDKSRGYVLVNTEFVSDPRFKIQCRSARFFFVRSKTWNCCDAWDAKTMVKKKKMGIGAVCSSPKRYLHSQKDNDANYPNVTQRDRLEGILVVDQGVLMVNHKDQVCIFLAR